MKTIFVSGIHTINLGDDLFMQILFERYAESRIVLFAPEIYKTLFEKYNNVIVVTEKDETKNKLMGISRLLHLSQTSILYLYLIYKYNISLFLIIGGSLFMEGNSNMLSTMKKMRILKVIVPKLKVAIIGANFGPCKTAIYYQKVKNSLRYADDVCFRDQASYDAFSGLTNVRWGNDVVMHINTNLSVKKKKVVCINIRSVEKWPTLRPHKEKYLNIIKSFVSEFQREGYFVRLLSFCEKYGDNDITDELYNLLEGKNVVEKVYYKGDIHEIINKIVESEFMLATRFHAIILGLVYKIKVLPVSYSIKTENMLKTYGIWNDVYDFAVFSNSSCQELKQHFISDMIIDKNKNTQFDWLDKFLEYAI